MEVKVRREGDEQRALLVALKRWAPRRGKRSRRGMKGHVSLRDSVSHCFEKQLHEGLM